MVAPKRNCCKVFINDIVFVMKKRSLLLFIPVCIVLALFIPSLFARQQQEGYILEHEAAIAKTETGPHKGGGTTTAHKFFDKATDSKLQFTKRILHPGAAIGYHLQKEEEIYYIVSGDGEMMMNGKIFIVSGGDAILTHAGSSHGLKQTGKDNLVVIINYEKK